MKIKNLEKVVFRKGDKTTCILKGILFCEDYHLSTVIASKIVEKKYKQFFPKYQGFGSMEFQIIGRSNRNPQDAENSEFGEQLAESRAKKTLFKVTANINSDVMEAILATRVEHLNNNRIKYALAAEREAFHQEELLKEE